MSPPHPLVAIASSGGHLTQALAVLRDFSGRDVAVITDQGQVDHSAHTQGSWTVFPNVGRSPARFLSTGIRQVLALWRARPALVLTTGSGWCLPAMVFGRMLRYPTVFLESFSRIEAPSGFGKIAYLFANKTLFQWPELGAWFPRGTLVQPVFAAGDGAPQGPRAGTFVTVGTYERGMDRLIRAADELASKGLLPEPVFMQTGGGHFVPAHARWAATMSRAEFATRLQGAELVISHAGAGVIGQALSAGTRIVVFPRDPTQGEIVDKHQQVMAERLASEGVIWLSKDTESLARVVGEARASSRTTVGMWGPALDRPTAAAEIRAMGVT